MLGVPNPGPVPGGREGQNVRMSARYHLNADVGEGFDTDAALIEIVTQVNVACGFHAGDADTMRTVCSLARDRGVDVGAQPSYRDRENFGRVDVEIGYDDLVRDLTEQVETLQAIARSVGVVVSYVKPHGALYNRVVRDEQQALAVVDVALRHGLPLLTLPGSVSERVMRERGGRALREFFADRAYAAEGRLVARSEPGALITDPAEVGARVRQLVSEGTLRTIEGETLAVDADSICVHGDSPRAVELAAAVRDALGSAVR